MEVGEKLLQSAERGMAVAVQQGPRGRQVWDGWVGGWWVAGEWRWSVGQGC